MRKFYSSLFLSLGICAVASAQFTGFTGTTNSGFPTNNVVPLTGGIGTPFLLTNETNHFGQAKGVWANATQSLASNFSVCAQMNFGRFNESGLPGTVDLGAAPGKQTDADGIAFILSLAAANPSAPYGPYNATNGIYIGETGEEMGYGTSFYSSGFTQRNTIAVEFDTWQNHVPTVDGARDLGDPAADHMAFMRRGSASHLNVNGVNNTVTPIVPLPELETNTPWEVKISWNTITGLSVDLVNPAAPATHYTMSTSVADVLAALGAANTNVNVNWGFNSGTGLAANNQTVTIVNCVVPPPSCGPARTQTMGAWGQGASGNNPGSYRDAHFASAFPTGVTIGLPGRSAKWTTAAAVETYLPAGGPSSVLPAGNLVNPTLSQLKNNAAGQVLTLSLSVGFDNADPNFSPSNTALQDYIIASGPYAGMSVGAFLTLANNVLGTAGSTATQVSNVQTTATAINENFDDGTTDNGYLNCPATARPGAQIENQLVQPTVNAATSVTAGAFPNPSRGQFRFNMSQVDAKAQILIVNSRGAIVERRSAGNLQSISFDLKKYGVGVYMIKVVSGNDIKTTKVIVQE